MNTRTMKTVAVAFAAMSAISVASADVIRTPGALSLDASMQTFESMNVGVVGNTFTTGNLTFSSATGLAITSISGYPANGSAVTSLVLQPVRTVNVGPGASYSPLTIEFNAPVKEVLLGWFDPNFEGNVLQAFDSNGNLLEEAPVDLGPVGGFAAAYIGFVHQTADIKSIRMVNPSGDDVYAVDNIQTVVPAPGAGLAMALAGCVAVRRRRTR